MSKKQAGFSVAGFPLRLMFCRIADSLLGKFNALIRRELIRLIRRELKGVSILSV